VSNLQPLGWVSTNSGNEQRQEAPPSIAHGSRSAILRASRKAETGRSKPYLKMATGKPQSIGVLKLSLWVFISSSF
jgi:hypothetical protein